MNKTPEESKRYLTAMKKLAGTVEPGTVVVMKVPHDDWCAHWKGDVCNCDPDIKSRGLKDD